MAFRIGKLFHLIHMSDDYAELDHWYWDVFRVRGGWHHAPGGQYLEIEKREADLVALADAVIEPMAPAMRVEGWDQLPVGRFYQRFGRHWHSIAWFVEEMPELYDHLRANGIRIFGLGGGGVDERPERSRPIYPHPKDTVGALELMERRIPPDGPEPPGGDPRYLPGYDPLWWARHHPLGLERLNHVTLVCGESEKARHVYVDVLGGTVLHKGDSPLTETQSTFVAVGDGNVVEIATPIGGDSLAAADLKANGDIFHAATWKVVDLDRAERHLKEKGINILDKDADTLLADPKDTYGAVMRFTTWQIPGDTREANR